MEIKYNPNGPQYGALEYWENGTKIMAMGGGGAETVWVFYTRNVIKVSPGMDLYDPLKEFMAQEYEFDEEDPLKCSRTPDKLVWYSDENPFVWDVKAVSYLTIKRKGDSFELQSRNQIYEEIGNNERPLTIAFSPAGNGRFSSNKETGFSLQSDFNLIIYNPLYDKYSKQRENNPIHRKTYPN